MKNCTPRILETQIVASPGTGGDSSSRDLPEDLLRETTGRVKILALVGTTLWTYAFVMEVFVGPSLMLPTVAMHGGPFVYAVAGTAIAASVAFWLYTRRHGCDPRHVLDLALVYLVFNCAAIGLLNAAMPVVEVGRASWVALVLLIFPMIAPNTPRKTLVAGLIGASMDPLGFAIASARGLPAPSADLILVAALPNYISALLGVIPSHIITRLGRQVTRARELGSYQLVELIGRGGMGEVWRATHRLLKRPAAVKLIKPEVVGDGDPGATGPGQRFRREAEAASA